MAESKRDKIANTASIWQTTVYPAIAGCFQGKFLPVEGIDDESLLALDRHAGIDMLYVGHIGGITGCMGVSVRIQPIPDGTEPYNTFTLRCTSHDTSGNVTLDCEVRKYSTALGHPDYGLIRPTLMIQAYVRETTHELLSVAIARIDDIMAVYDEGWWESKGNRSDGNSFCVIRWDRLPRIIKPLESVRNLAYLWS